MQSSVRIPRSRRVTLGVQGLVVDAEGRVLLIRHTYRPGWHFPGGGVERGEGLERALERELYEEAGVVPVGPPRLFAFYTHFRIFPGDHVALYVVERWRQPLVPEPNSEIAEQGFFRLDALPPGITSGTEARLGEVFGGLSAGLAWT